MSKKAVHKWKGCLRFMNNLSKNTIISYQQAIGKYEDFHGADMESLIEEALDEQSNQVPIHKLKVIDRLENFQQSLIDDGFTYGTVSIHIGKIKSIYHKNRVELPYIEPVNAKKCKRHDVIEFKDILTHDELRRVLPLMRLPMRARAMAMIQGGLSNEECEHLTTRAFIDELSCYHQKDNDVDALEWLADENNPVIWVTKLVRVKTGKPYYAIIGAEAINVIAEAKLYEMELPSNNGEIPNKLLNTNKKTMNNLTVKLNKKLGFGQAGGRNRFRPHSLRKFHATYISGSALSYEEHSIISNAEIDEMQGRGKTSVQDTYIKTNPLRQKTLYAKVMNNVSLWHKYDYVITGDDVRVFLVDPNVENQKLKEEIKDLKNHLHQKQIASDRINALREEIGDEDFNDIIMGIIGAK